MAMIVGSVAGSSPAGWTGLSGAIKSELWARQSGGGAGHADFDDLATGLATAMIDYFKSNMDVVGVATNVAVTSVSGVTTGPGVSGPGTGSGAQTGTGGVL